MITRRTLLGSGLVILGTHPVSALAQSGYPNRPIRWVVSSPPGSPIDAIGRKLAEVASARLGVPVVIENKPGAAGTIGAAEVARAAPDGYTLLLTVGDALVSSAVTMKLPYDPQKDFRLISKIAAAGPVLIASKSLKAGNLAELIALAKSSGTPLAYGSYGPGSYPQQIMESMARQAGVKFNAIPYKGSPPATTDLLAGHLPLSFTAANVAAPLLAEGKLKVLAIIGDRRSSVLPQVPTFAESGFEAFVFRNKVWVGLAGPGALPDAAVQKLSAAIQQAASDPGFRKYLADIGFDLVANSPSQFRDEYKAEFEIIPALIKSLGVTPQ